MELKTLVFLVAALYSQCGISQSIYSIGNSLIDNGVPGAVALMHENSLDVSDGYHLRWGALFKPICQLWRIINSGYPGWGCFA